MTVQESPIDIRSHRSKLEMAACTPPSGMTVSQWAAKHRHLDPAHAANVGKWRNERTPYLVEIMDSMTDLAVEWITVQKSAQCGLTEAAINAMLFFASEDPAPMLVVYPTLKSAKKILRHRLKAAIDYCDEAAAQYQHLNLSDMELLFNRMRVQFVGSESPTDLATWPIRRCVFDETDKMVPFSGVEASPIALAEERTITYPNRLLLAMSTPTTQHGFIAKNFELSDKRRYHVPCPYCDHYQILIFDGLWYPDDEKNPEKYKEDRGIAKYTCAGCGELIPHSRKAAMVRKGVWCPEGSTVGPGGVLEHPDGYVPARHRGYHINALISPFVTFDRIIAKWLEAQGDLGRLMSFTNSTMGNPWIERELSTTTDHIRGREWSHHRGTVPDEAVVLTAGVDVQKDHFWYVVRAWGYGQANWLVQSGRLETWDEVTRVVTQGVFPSADGSKHYQVARVAVDSSYDTLHVYSYCRRFPNVIPVQGEQKLAGGVPVQPTTLEKHLPGYAGPVKIKMRRVNNDLWKRQIMHRMRSDHGDEGAFWVHADIDDRYCEHMTSEELVPDRNKRTGEPVYNWQPRSGGGPNHIWDCEVYAAAAAWTVNVYMLRDPEAVEAASINPSAPPERRPAEPDSDQRRPPGASTRRRPRVGGNGDFFRRRRGRRR